MLTVQINPTSAGIAVAGNNYSLNCIVSKSVSGLTNEPQIEWIGPDGNEVLNTDGIFLSGPVNQASSTIVTLSFIQIRTSSAGQYQCHVTLPSQALNTALSAVDTQDVSVAGNVLLCTRTK